jgi:NADH-quinone oxidoreductase subunit L
MYSLLWLIPVVPFAGFLLLAIFGGRMEKKAAGIIGVGSIGISAVITILTGIEFLVSPPPGHVYVQTLYTWIKIGYFAPAVAFHLDALSLVFIFIITFVGFLIHLYSSEFMIDDEGYSRFFAYMNLFVGSMITLVLANNLLLLYLGWEGVGLCSYLLIGFWYDDPDNVNAGRKAFIVTRIGDTAMGIGLFLLVKTFGTLNIQQILHSASVTWVPGSSIANAVALLLLGGAVGKSAQLPLQTWLPDAMAGPTPVSALIHAATMVTAGVYLIARTNVLFTLSPAAQLIVAIIGAATLVLAGFSAITQKDIKRVLAYSTISQIGYMFLALGVGAWSAGIFHFMTHAFFKALLFLGAGVVILAQHHKHDMFEMGGLRKLLPLTFWTFLIASASLAALPIITAGFYSKDLILWHAFADAKGSFWLWLAGIVGAFITSIYTFRMVFLTFYGESKTEISYHPGIKIKIPLVVLGFLSFAWGFIELPKAWANFTLLSDFLKNLLPTALLVHKGAGLEILFELISAAVAIGGVFIAYYLYMKSPVFSQKFRATKLNKFWFEGWGFDWIYDKVFVQPVIFFARINKADFIDQIYTGIAMLTVAGNRVMSFTQSGKLRWYAIGIVIGSILTLTIVVFL